MVRAKVWFRCAAVGDPITPVLVKPAVLGWEGKFRDITLTIERPFKGDEFLRRMKGWVTLDVNRFIDIVKKYGFLKLLDDRYLVIETETEEDFKNMKKELSETFGNQFDLERIA